MTIVQMIADQVSNAPDRTAIQFQKRCWTYRELEWRVTAMAMHLVSLGIGRGKLVAISLERSADLVAALLAVLKSGAAYLPLNPSLPPAYVRAISADSQPDLMIVATADPFSGEDLAIKMLSLDTLSHPEKTPPITFWPDLDDLAYVIYTSGSSGKPKGVEISHRALANALVSIGKLIEILPTDTLLAATTVSFDISALELFLPLVKGAQVILASSQDSSDAHSLRDLAVSSHATVFQATPALWRFLLTSGGVPSSLRIALCGGERMPVDVANGLASLPHVSAWNLYGPTETTIWSTAQRLDSPPYSASPPIGHPIDNTLAFIYTSEWVEAPVGTAGILYLGGAGLAQGYRNNAVLTQARFAYRTSSDGSNIRLYRTGDIVRWNSVGVLEFLGREDNQVKVRGFRIELEEVESRLQQVPGVADAAVGLVKSGDGEDVLAAYIVQAHQSAVPIMHIRDTLTNWLPDYMVPTRFYKIDRLPRNTSGKLDRRAFHAGASWEDIDPYIAPRNDLERKIAQIWSDALGVARVGARDDFFALGGHSLLASMVILGVSDAYGVHVTMSELFEYATVAGLARLVAERQGGESLEVTGPNSRDWNPEGLML